MAIAEEPQRAFAQAGNVAGVSQEEWATQFAAQTGPATRLGPFESVHVFWLAGMSCDGCSIAVVGATMPSVESLLTGSLPGVPIVFLHHTALQVEAGEAYMAPMRKAVKGELGEYETLLSNRKTRDVLGFQEAHNWRRYVKS